MNDNLGGGLLSLISADQLLGKVIETATNGIFLLDHQGRYELINPACGSMLGLTPEDWLGKQAGEFAHPDDRDHLTRVVLQALQGSCAEAEARIKGADGFYRFMRIAFSPVVYSGHRYVLGVVTDLTCQKRIESALKKEKERAEAYLDIAGVMFLGLDLNGGVVLLNRQGEQILGWPEDELKGKNWFETCLFPEDRPPIRQFFEEIIEKRLTERHVESRVRTRSGEERLILWRGAAALDERGEAAGTLSSGEDITEKQAALLALKESEERFQVATKLASDYIYEFDFSNWSLKWSGDVDRLFGFEPGGFPRSWQDTVEMGHPEDRPRFFESLKRCLEKGSPLKEVYRVRKKDGSYLWISSRGQAIWDEQGQLRRWIGVNTDVTEAKQAEEALKESEERYRLSFNYANDVIYTISPDFTINMVSPSVKRILGYDPEEIVGKKIHELGLVAPESMELAVNNTLQLLAGESLSSEEFVFIAKDGSRKVGEVSGAPVFQDGQIISLVNVARDITERKQLEQSLREIEARYSSLFNNPHDAVYIHDVNGNFVDANDAALELLGHRREEIRLLNFADLLDGRDQLDKALAVLEEIVATGRQKQLVEYRLRRKDGSIIEIETMGAPVHQEGKPPLLQGIARDITEKKAVYRKLDALKTELESERAMLRSMLDNMEEVVIMADQDDVIRDVNPMGERVFGKSRDEILGRSLHDFHPGEIGERVREIMDRLKSGEERFISLKRPLGDYWMDLRLSPIRSARGTYQGVILNLVDVTSLVEAQQEAEAASQAKTRFLANMSHEIRTPMNGILGFAELLKNSPLNEQQRRKVEIILQSGRHLLELINQVLDLARISSGKVLLQPELTSPRALAREVMDMIRPLAEDKRLDLIQKISPATPENLIADRKKLFQILINLLGNAVKFTERGEVELGLDFHPGEKPMLAISVKDTGAGVPKEKQQIIFRPFEQIEEGLDRTHQGAGLGLAIVNSLVKVMGGTIRLESEPGRGTAFILTVPVELAIEKQPADAGQTRAYDPTPKSSPEESSSGVVLVIDDFKPDREIMVRMLENLGLTPIMAENGEDGILRAQFHEPSAIILDLKLPDRPGRKILEELKTNPVTSGLPVIIASVLDEDPALLEQGAEAFLTKPFDQEELKNCLIRAGLELKPQGASPAPRFEDRPRPPLILVVEDNDLNREFLRELLIENDYQVAEAENGEEFLRLIEQRRPDLALLDMAMPVMDGMTATRRLRAMPEHQGLPVIALTAAALPGDRERFLEAGCNDYLAKPFTPEQLLETIGRYVRPPAKRRKI